MQQLPPSIIIVIAVLTAFLTVTVALTYAIRNNFVRTRLIMTLFFLFIVTTLSVSFWDHKYLTFPYTIPSAALGAILGYFLGVRAAEKKLRMQGLAYYTEHFAHIHIHEIKSLNWWTLINFYSVMGGLLLINLVGLSSVIFRGAEEMSILTSMVGAFLIGTIVPYLMHLWRLKPTKFK